jgi:cold shock CspA family protein
MFGIIDAFERDMREMIDRYLLGEMAEEDLLGSEYEDAARKRANDAPDGHAPISDYLDLRPAYDLLNRYRELLPQAYARELRENTTSLDIIVPIRNRVMHGRPLKTNDDESLQSAVGGFTTRWWPRLREALTSLSGDPGWVPERSFEPVIGRVLHNLPLPEYDETGLLGRDELVARVTSALKRRRDSVITLAGEGGIGKTAVAVAAAHELAADPEMPFELILWASFKAERLTGRGVEQLDNAVRGMTGAIEVLSRSLGGPIEPSLASLAEALDGIKCLLILDNLESVSGDEFVDLYEALPESVQYLVTSRQGIGQIERRLVVGPLDERASLLLLNQMIKARPTPALASISGEARREIVSTLRFSPLAIRWFILAVEAGRDPAELLRHQDELLDFCVRSVHAVLTPEARLVLAALEALGRPVALDDLAVLTGESVTALMSGLQELTKGSLVTTSLSSERATVSLFALTETARRYVAAQLDSGDEMRLKVLEAENQFRLDEERRASDMSRRSLAPIVVRSRTALDAPTAQLLRRALLRSQVGDLDGAYAFIREARSLNPEFWEVDRVEAFVRAVNGDGTLASKLYLDAYAAAETPEHKAIVAHFFAGHLARNIRDLARAEEYATEAHEVLQAADTATALATTLIWAGKFDAGIPLLHWAVENSVDKSRLISLTTLVEAYRRFSEHACTERRNPIVAREYADQGLRLGLSAVDAGIRDRRLVDSVCETLTQFMRATRQADETPCLEVNVASQIERLQATLRRSRYWPHLRDELLRGDATEGTWQAALLGPAASGQPDPDSVADPTTWNERDEEAATAAGWLSGIVCNLEPTYGFVAHEDFPENLFFPAGAVRGGPFASLARQDRVWFSLESGETERPRASVVWLVPPTGAPRAKGVAASQEDVNADAATFDRIGEEPLEASVSFIGVRRFGFVSLASFRQDAFFHANVCEQGAFDSLAVEQRVWVRLQLESDGRLRVTELRLRQERAKTAAENSGRN